MNFVGSMIRLEVVIETGGGEWVSEGVDNEDKGDQHSENFISESCCMFDHLVDVHETSDKTVNHNP